MKIVLGLLVLCPLMLWSAGKIQPLNIKTGLWQTTITSAASGRPPIPPDMLAKMTPEQRAKFEAAMNKMATGTPKTKTYKNCVTKEKLNKDPFSGEKSCTETVLTSTGSKMKVREVCMKENVKTDTTIQLDAVNSENVKGQTHVTSTGGGKTMNVNGTFTAKWLGTACGDVK